MKICENCNSIITAKRGKRRFCSVSCLNEHQRKTGNNVNKKCVDCGNVFNTPCSQEKRVTRCPECIKKKFIGMIEKTCNICGKNFYVSQYRKDSAKYCSRLCKYKAPVTGRKILKHKECPQCKKMFMPASLKLIHCSRECYQKSIERFYVCQSCGISFRRMPRTMKPVPMFCSIKCRADYFSGNNHHCWKGGVRYFGRDDFDIKKWKQIIRPHILDRDNYTCKRCGANQETEILNVHHIIPWSISKNDSDENLITLCRSCHKFVEDNYANKGDFSLSFIP